MYINIYMSVRIYFIYNQIEWKPICGIVLRLVDVVDVHVFGFGQVLFFFDLILWFQGEGGKCVCYVFFIFLLQNVWRVYVMLISILSKMTFVRERITEAFNLTQNSCQIFFFSSRLATAKTALNEKEKSLICN